MDISRHEFLAALHKALKPKVYLEIGVQYGQSLVLAEAAELAIGIDPEPLTFAAPQNWLPNQVVYTMTSDHFFSEQAFSLAPIDLAFIDGMHLFEHAMCDYVNVQKHMRPGGVIVFDDVLPYNQEIAARVQPPGDWTGDVWKCYYLLEQMHESGLINSRPFLVNTSPTGTMVLLNVEPTLSLPARFSDKELIREWFSEVEQVPGEILLRATAVQPAEILEKINEHMEEIQ